MSRLYAADPFLGSLAPADVRTVSVHAVDADRLENDEYRERLFLADQLAGKLSLIVQVPEQALSLSIYRRVKHGAFADDDVARVSALGEVLSAALERHCALQQLGRGEPGELAATFAELPLEKPLSEREAAVCAHIILGRSNYAIAADLDLSFHSVSTYRRRAYAKLGVRSQSELFALLWSRTQTPPC